MNVAKYCTFKKQVIKNAGYECEICKTTVDLTVHHMLKQSTYPQYRTHVDNGVCLCGLCHSKIEQLRRDGEDFYNLIPHRLEKAHRVFGVTWKDLGLEREEQYAY